MAWPLRAVAVLAGALNALAYDRITSSEELIGDWAGEAPWTYTATLVFLAGCVGLVVAEALLLTVGEAMERDFWSRILAIWSGFVGGGALVSASVDVASQIVLLDLTTNNVSRSLLLAPVAVVAGGFVGLTEGFLLAVPLAALLGLSAGEIHEGIDGG